MTGGNSTRTTWVFLAALLAGCAASSGKPGDDARTMYVTQHPEIEPRFARAVLDGNVLVGMNRDMVKTSWGEPTRIEKLPIGNEKGEERWTFGNYLVNNAVTHLYFRNNEVVLYEFVDTKNNSTQSVNDPNERLRLLPPTPSDTGTGAKGSP